MKGPVKLYQLSVFETRRRRALFWNEPVYDFCLSSQPKEAERIDVDRVCYNAN